MKKKIKNFTLNKQAGYDHYYIIIVFSLESMKSNFNVEDIFEKTDDQN